LSLDAPRPRPPHVARAPVDVHAMRALVACVLTRVEGDLPGRRFPLLRVVGDRGALSGIECEALVWELARVRTILSTLPADDALGRPPADGASGASEAGLVARRLGAGRRTLADAHEATILALDRAARLGAANRRGACFEVAADELRVAAVAARPEVEGR